MKIPKFHIFWNLNKFISINKDRIWQSDGLIDILKKQSKSDECEPRIGILLIDDMLCQVNPTSDIIFDIVLDEFDEAVGQYGLTIVHDELFLLKASVAFV